MVRRSRPAWHRHRIPARLASFILRPVGGARRSRATLAPQVRGHVQPRVVEALEERGWHVHRIGAAAYVHADAEHLIFGVWPRRSAAPTWAGRLGRASAAYLRRLKRATRAQLWRRQLRDQRTGQFSQLRPWIHWPAPALYAWQTPGPSVAEQIDELEAASRRRWLASFPADAPELELRALDGDR